MKRPQPPYTRELVEFLAGLAPEKLPKKVFDQARSLLLDYLGVAVRGSRVESSAPVYKMIRRAGVSGSATILGTAACTSAGYAALANGTAAHAVEMDDTHNAGSIHLGVVMFSTALALAETLGDVSAGEFFTAVVAGYETAARIAMAVGPRDHYELGFHPTATCGVFGAAVTASKMMRLSQEQMLSAVGIAGSMAAGSLEFLAQGAWTKRLHPGLAAQNGIQAALLADEGFRGPSTILEGRDGFLFAHSRDAAPDSITDGLGKSYEILNTSVKPHACCRYMQGPIDAIIALVKEHDLKQEDIGEIHIAVLEAGWNLIAEPSKRKRNPKSVVDAQFSMPFGAAVAVLHRAAGIDQFTQENIDSQLVGHLIGCVTLEKDVRIEKNFPEEWRAYVTIDTMDEDHFEKWLIHPKGDPKNPLTWAELVTKFRSLAGPVLGKDRCAQIVEQIPAAHPASLAVLCRA